MRTAIGAAVLVLIIALIGGIIGGCTYLFEFNDKDYTITVTEKERVNDDNSSKYLIWGEDEEGEEYVFKNSDCMMRGKFDSSSVYGKIKRGKKYKFTVVGYRMPFFSEYENIIKFKEVK